MELSELRELLEEDNWEEINSELDTILEEADPPVLDLLSQHVRYAETLEDLIYHYQERRIRSEQNLKAIRSSARYVLTHLAQLAARDYLCQQFINDPDEEILELCHTGGYLPSRADQQALFFVLSRQWPRYDELTRGDHALLKQALQKADGALLRKVAQATRESGRPEVWRAVLPSLTPESPEESPRPLDSELINLIEDAGHYAELWELAMQTSPYWSYRILRQLNTWGWRPDDSEERLIFERLLELTEALDYKVEKEVLETVEIIASFPLGPFRAVETDNISPYTIGAYENKPVRLSPDGQTLTRIVVNSDFTITNLEVLEISSRRVIVNLDISTDLPPELNANLAKPPFLIDFAYSADSNLLVCMAKLDLITPNPDMFSTGIWLYDIGQRQFVGNYYLETEVAPTMMKFNSVGQKLALAARDWFALYQFQPGSSPLTKLTPETPFNLDIVEFAISPDGQYLATGRDSIGLDLLTLPNLEKIQRLAGEGLSTCVIEFSPDGKILAYGEILQWFDLNEPLNIHNTDSGGHSVVFSSDSRMMAACTASGEHFLWDIAEKTQYYFQVGEDFEGIAAIAFGPNNQSLVSVNEQGLVRVQSLRLFWLYHLPIKQSKLEDFLWLQARAADPERSEEERAICEFAAAQYAIKWRYDVEVEPTGFPPMAHDVELEDQR